MWVPETWLTEEDVERDLLLFAEYSIPSPRDLDPNLNPVPDTILQYKKQMAANKQKTFNSDLDDTVNMSYVVSGRGRGISDRVIRPGGTIEHHPSDDLELKRQIRQVSGIGYSNELIEKSIKAKSFAAEKRHEEDSRFKLVSSSSKSSGEESPVKKTNKKTDEFPPLK